jgi:endonuclease G
MNYPPKFILLVAFVFLYDCKLEPTAAKQELVSEKIVSETIDLLPKSTTNQVVEHAFYTLSYHEKYEQAEWVAYQLKPQSSQNQHFERPFFIQDKKVTTQSADWKNYRKSGYDKGHLCAAADMKFSKTAFDDTFLTSNISPQKHDFNDGIWNRLEQKTRYWATKYNGVYVITGGVLTDDLKTIGQENVAVPNYFYKIIFRETNQKKSIIAFLVPAKESNEPLYNFVTSVDIIEKTTGIDFFPNLQDTIENTLEKSNDYKSWSFN